MNKNVKYEFEDNQGSIPYMDRINNSEIIQSQLLQSKKIFSFFK